MLTSNALNPLDFHAFSTGITDLSKQIDTELDWSKEFWYRPLVFALVGRSYKCSGRSWLLTADTERTEPWLWVGRHIVLLWVASLTHIRSVNQSFVLWNLCGISFSTWRPGIFRVQVTASLVIDLDLRLFSMNWIGFRCLFTRWLGTKFSRMLQVALWLLALFLFHWIWNIWRIVRDILVSGIFVRSNMFRRQESALSLLVSSVNSNHLYAVKSSMLIFDRGSWPCWHEEGFIAKSGLFDVFVLTLTGVLCSTNSLGVN